MFMEEFIKTKIILTMRADARDVCAILKLKSVKAAQIKDFLRPDKH